MNYKFGLKLWSINENYITEAINLYNDSIYEYIELYTVPDSFDKFCKKWKDVNIKFIIHAPHYYGGVNLSNKNNYKNNKKYIEQAKKWADYLKAEYIIIHPGINGCIDNTISVIKDIYDNRLLIENMPYYALENIGICKGSSIREINQIIDYTGVGFCLDIGHAIYSANSKKEDYFKNIFEFNNINPKMYHLSDGINNDILDKHLNFGEGNFEINKILKLLKKDSMITIETNKKSDHSLNNFVNDIKYLNSVEI